MARQAEFNSIANELSVRYTHFLDTILSSYNRAILSTDLTARGLDHFRKEVGNIHQQFLEREVDHIVRIYNSVKDMVDTDTQTAPIKALDDEQWATHLDENTNFLYESIKLQSSKDVLYVNNFLRSKAIQLNSVNDYQKAYNLVFNHKDLNFYYTDKLGRKINSVKYVRTAARDYLVKNYNDLVAGTAILNGIDTLVVENVDSNHENNGKIISVNEANDVNYFDIRDEMFHPNTNSIVRLP